MSMEEEQLALLKKHAAELNVIKDQLEQSTQKDALYEMVESIYLEIGKTTLGITDMNTALADLRATMQRKEEESKAWFAQLRTETEHLRTEKSHLAALLGHRDRELAALRDERNMLLHFLERMQAGTRSILNSSRWKIGNTIGEIKRKLLLRPQEPLTADHLIKTMEEIDAWKNDQQT